MLSSSSVTAAFNALTPNNAKLYGHLFENKTTGLKKGLFFSFECGLVGEGAPELPRPILIQIDWMSWPLRSWKDLATASLSTLERPSLVEASIYVGEHEELTLEGLALSERQGATFLVSATFARSGTPVGGIAVRANLSDIYIAPAAIELQPHDPTAARHELEHFIDPDEWSEPCWERFRYVSQLRPSSLT